MSLVKKFSFDFFMKYSKLSCCRLFHILCFPLLLFDIYYDPLSLPQFDIFFNDPLGSPGYYFQLCNVCVPTYVPCYSIGFVSRIFFYFTMQFQCSKVSFCFSLSAIYVHMLLHHHACTRFPLVPCYCIKYRHAYSGKVHELCSFWNFHIWTASKCTSKEM